MDRITLFLMSYKGYFILQSFINEFGPDKIDFVVTSKDSNVQNDYYTDIIGLCKANNIKCYDRRDDYKPKTQYAFAISWRWLINLDKTILIVLHDSLLPKYRGFAPLATALINGDSQVGVTALFASEEYDKGDIIEQRSVSIQYPIKINDAINLVSDCYFDLIKSITQNILNSKKISATVQNEKEASYSLWLDEKDYTINWNMDAPNIKRFIDSVGFPFNGAVTKINDVQVRIIDSEVINDVQIPVRHPGKVIFVKEGKPVVVCGKGLLKITEIVDESNNSLLPLKKFRSRFE